MPAGKLTLVALAALAALAAPSGASAGVRQADSRLSRAMHELVAMPDGPPGISVVVQRGEDRRLRTAGRAEVGRPGGIRLRQRMRIASVSKAFSGAVTLLLVQRGKLALGDTIGERLPELPASWGAVTLRELLQHTSGLPNYTADPDFLSYFATHLRDYISPAFAISFVTDRAPEFLPGSRYAYSNTDNIVIGLMAERVTGRTYEQLLRGLVSRRLGLRRTTLPSGFLLPRPFVSGYVFDAPGHPFEDVSEAVSASSTWAAGAIVSTPQDLNTFIRAWGGGTFLSRRLRRAQTRFIPGAAGEPPGPGRNSGGLALFRYRLPCGTVYGHTGNFPGYTQFSASSPDGSRSTVVSANLQLDVATGPPGVFPPLHRLFRLAACAALAG